MLELKSMENASVDQTTLLKLKEQVDELSQNGCSVFEIVEILSKSNPNNFFTTCFKNDYSVIRVG